MIKPWLFLGGVVLLLLGCGFPNEPPVNEPPVIEDLVVPDSVFTEDTATFTVSVSDPEDDNLSCEWKASGGRFISSSGWEVEWIAEDVFETVEVEVFVSDEYGASDSAQAHVRVSEWILAHLYSLEDGELKVIPKTLKINYSISGWVEPVGYGVHFYVFDSENYEKWKNEEGYEAEVDMEVWDTGPYDFEEFGFIVTKTDTYYFVIQCISFKGAAGCLYAIATSP